MSLFVNEKATIKVTVHYLESKRGILAATLDLKDVPEAERKDFKSVSFECRQLTWKQSNEVYRQSRKHNQLTQSEDVDWESYKENHLVRILVAWDAMDEDGHLVPMSPDNILKLHPIIAETIRLGYSSGILVKEEPASVNADVSTTESSVLPIPTITQPAKK